MRKKAVNKPLPRITKAVAAKVLEVVDAGLSRGLGNKVPGQMCVEAAVCYAMGEPHTDHPRCVTLAIRDTKININDHAGWGDRYLDSDDKEIIKIRKDRSKGLRRLAIAQLGSKGVITDKQWNDALYEYYVSKKPKAEQHEFTGADAKAQLLDAVKRIEAGECYVEVKVEWENPRENFDFEFDILNEAGNPKALKKLSEDLVKVLIKLKSPGTKYLHLTKK